MEERKVYGETEVFRFLTIQTNDSANFESAIGLQFDGDGCVDLSFFVGGIVDMSPVEKWRSCGEKFVSFDRFGGRRSVGPFPAWLSPAV